MCRDPSPPRSFRLNLNVSAYLSDCSGAPEEPEEAESASFPLIYLLELNDVDVCPCLQSASLGFFKSAFHHRLQIQQIWCHEETHLQVLLLLTDDEADAGES